MKKAVSILLVLLLVFTVACGKEEIKDSIKESVKGAPETEISKSVEEAPKSVFEQFKMALDAKGVEYEVVPMAAEMVGAKQGEKYKIENGGIELYKFDKESEAYKEAYENQALALEGFGAISATVDNGLAILFNDLDKASYIDIFNGLKTN